MSFALHHIEMICIDEDDVPYPENFTYLSVTLDKKLNCYAYLGIKNREGYISYLGC